jgi:hypothetical protein
LTVDKLPVIIFFCRLTKFPINPQQNAVVVIKGWVGFTGFGDGNDAQQGDNEEEEVFHVSAV